MEQPIIQITLDDRSVAFIRKLSSAPEQVRSKIQKTLDRENQLTVGRIQADKLSRRGPDTLGVVTNRLRGSIRASKAQITSDGLDSSIGTNVAYGGIHEFGFEGEITVKAHSRRVFTFLKGAATRVTFNPQTGKITKGKTVKRKETGTVQVRAHTRKLDYKGRAYIRRTLIERGEDYTVSIGSAVRELFS